MNAVMDWPRKWRLGVPYQGSKNQIAREIISILPSGKRFVDLFAGGCAVTHAAMISGKYREYWANDVNSEGLDLFKKAIDGAFANETRWISRDLFFQLKDYDPYVSICWSFGNSQRTYMYSKEIEPYKRAYHFAYFFGDYVPAHELGIVCLDGLTDIDRSERHVEMSRRLREYWKDHGTVKSKNAHGVGYVDLSLATLAKSQSLQSLERLQRLQSLQSLEMLKTSKMTYAEYEYHEGDVVYCDPPYANTTGYAKNGKITTFDSTSFWDWVDTRPYPVFVSEYNAPKGFTAIFQKTKRSILGAQINKMACEKVYVADRYADQFQTDLFLGVTK